MVRKMKRTPVDIVVDRLMAMHRLDENGKAVRMEEPDAYLHMNRTDLARILGMQRGSIDKILGAAWPRLETQQKIAAVFGMEALDLAALIQGERG